MATNLEVWTIGRMAALRAFDEDMALAHYAHERDISREQNEIFRDGYADVNKDFAEDLDRVHAY